MVTSLVVGVDVSVEDILVDLVRVSKSSKEFLSTVRLQVISNSSSNKIFILLFKTKSIQINF